MEIKEAIEFLEIDIKCLNREIEYCNQNDDVDAQVIIANTKAIEKYKEIISLLQQGEKYKQMYLFSANLCEELKTENKELKKYKKMWGIAREDIRDQGHRGIEYVEELDERYFPEEAKKDVNNT